MSNLQRSKILLAACIRKVIKFSSVEHMDAYIAGLKRTPKMFRVNSVEKIGGQDNAVVLDIDEQYNKNQLPVNLTGLQKGVK